VVVVVVDGVVVLVVVVVVFDVDDAAGVSPDTAVSAA
jgi:hypothetical protein